MWATRPVRMQYYYSKTDKNLKEKEFFACVMVRFCSLLTAVCRHKSRTIFILRTVSNCLSTKKTFTKIFFNFEYEITIKKIRSILMYNIDCDEFVCAKIHIHTHTHSIVCWCTTVCRMLCPFTIIVVYFDYHSFRF